MKDISNETMVRYAVALLLAVRCRSVDGSKQLLARFYHEMDEQQARTFMNRTIMLLEPRERDWLKSLC
mgnify:CR=1 FL=1